MSSQIENYVIPAKAGIFKIGFKIPAFAGMTLLVFIFSGCASVQMPGYISKEEHPYEQKIYGSLEKVTSTFNFVLKKQGWDIVDEEDPSVYERDDRYDNNGYRNLLIITSAKKHYRIVYSKYSRLNVFIHSLGNTCTVEIRYEDISPKIIQGLFDEVVKEING